MVKLFNETAIQFVAAAKYHIAYDAELLQMDGGMVGFPTIHLSGLLDGCPGMRVPFNKVVSDPYRFFHARLGW